jgi:hypothetical protein
MIARRAGIVGIPSGCAFTKRTPWRATASIARVRARFPYTWSARRLSITTTTTFILAACADAAPGPSRA